MSLSDQIIQPAQVVGPGNSSSLSADGIATTLGYADAATLTAAIDAGAEQAVGTTDSPQFAGINLGHASDTTLTRVSAGVVAVEGTTLQSLLSSTNKLALAAGGSNADLSATGAATHFLRQASAGAAITVGAIATTDLPTTLQAGTNSGGNFQVTGHLYLNSGGKLQPGTGNNLVISAGSGGVIYLQDGTNNQAWVNSDGLNAYALYAYNIYSQGSSASHCSVSGRRQINGSDSAALVVYADNHATYPGAHQQFAPLSTRAASTAIALCPVATGDTAEVEIHETTIAGCKAFVDAAGTVTLYSPIYGTVSASIVNSSSPAAGEYGVYISAGVLYFKGGSSYAGKMAHKDFVGKA